MAEPANNFQALLKHLSILKSLRNTGTLPLDAAEGTPPEERTEPRAQALSEGDQPSTAMTGDIALAPPPGVVPDPRLPIAHMPPQQQQLMIEALRSLANAGALGRR
jgi:hypothetical protein